MQKESLARVVATFAIRATARASVFRRELEQPATTTESAVD